MTLYLFYIGVPVLLALLGIKYPAKILKRLMTFYILVGIGLSLYIFILFFTKQKSGFSFTLQQTFLDISTQGGFVIKLPFTMGIDFITSTLLLLQFLVAGISLTSVTPKTAAAKTFWVWLFILHLLCSCAFLATSFFWFFIFFELLIIPTFFLISGWGGARRFRAGIKYFLYSFISSILLFIALILIISENTSSVIGYGNNISNYALSVFFLLLAGFSVKIPIVGFHGWLPEAHYEASTPISIILAGTLLKIGGYGLLRFGFIEFSAIASQYIFGIMFWGAISIFYGSACALAQRDLKKLIAYSSIAHMGFVVVGFASITSQGWSGSIFQLFSHGLLSSLMFFWAGAVYEKTNTFQIDTIKTNFSFTNKFAYIAGISIFASMGLPGFSAFIAELLVIWSIIEAAPTPTTLLLFLLLSGLGLIIGVIYSAYLYHRIFNTFHNNATFIHISNKGITLMIIILGISLLIGILPNILIEPLEAAILSWQ